MQKMLPAKISSVILSFFQGAVVVHGGAIQAIHGLEMSEMVNVNLSSDENIYDEVYC